MLKINDRALERVCKLLDVKEFKIELIPEPMNPAGLTILEKGQDPIIKISTMLGSIDANWIVLHELKHVQQWTQNPRLMQEYEDQYIEAGFDPELLDPETGRGNWEPDAKAYENISFEKEANDFASNHNDLYEVIVEA